MEAYSMTSLLSLDPSSSACGVAFFPDVDARDPAPTVLQVIRPRPGLLTIQRIDLLVVEVLGRVRELRPAIVLMEYSSGKVHGKIRDRRPTGQGPLWQCQGEIRRSLMMYSAIDFLNEWRKEPYKVETVDESWTCRVPKPERALRIAAEFPTYDEFLRSGLDGSWKGDPRKKWDGKGLDAADAVGIGLWWIGKRKERQIMEAGR